MAQSRVFTLLGDSNVQRHVNKASLRANPAMKSAQILSCGHIGIFKDMLAKVRSQSCVCIVACLTNFLCKADGPESVSQRIDPVLGELREILDAACSDHPDRFYIISPPMYRTSPVWYREGLPEVLTTFSQTMNQEKPPNLLLMPSFPTPAYQSDGVHLTPYSGLEYLMHLFDSSEEVIATLQSSPDVATARNTEGTRVLEDRVVALEQDHRRLNRVVEGKIAIDAEISDFHDNERMLDFLVVAGLDPIDPDLFGKAWQDQAVKNVQEVFKLLMGKTMDIVYVKNATARHKDAIVTYNVQMRTIAESKEIRDKFGSYFLGGKSKLPDALKRYSIRNRVTPNTKVRRSVLQVIGRRYQTSNPGSKVQVVGYDPRPLIKITPASDANDRRVQVYNYIEAVKTLPATFNPTELDFIMKKINPKLCGQLGSLFIVLSDDVFRKRLSKNKFRSVRQDQVPAPATDGEASSESENESSTEDTRSGSAPAPAPVSVPVPAAPAISLSRSKKRGATTSPGNEAPAKK